MILEAHVCDEVADIIKSPEDFHKPAHATVYQALMDCYQDKGTIDMVLLTSLLLDRGVLEQVGGVDYLVELLGSVPSAVSAGYYARQVRDKADCRRVIDLCGSTIQSIYKDNGNPSELIDSTMSALTELRAGEAKNEAHVSHWLDEAMEDDRPTIDCGMRAVDEIIEGFELGTLSIIGARPSVGKTAFMVSAGLSMTSAGVPTGIVSAEMTGRRVGRRLVCTDAQISTKEFEREKDTEAIRDIIAQQRSLPLWVDQTPGIHIDRVCSRIRRWRREHGIQAAWVDYLQLVGGDGDSDYERVTTCARKLQALSKELDIALFVLAQVNRESEHRADKRPAMSNLKGSGEIEQAADVIMLLHREACHASGVDILEGSISNAEAEVIVAKNRDGRTGIAHVGWIERCGGFASGIGAGVGYCA